MWRYGLAFLFLLLSTAAILPQNALQKDSAWVSEMLAGKDTIRLNPEYLKAIENGTLINLGQPLEIESSRLPILKDFSEYIKVDTVRRLLQIDSLPPAVFWLYQTTDTIYQNICENYHKPIKSLVISNQVRLGKTPFYGRAGTQILFLPEVKDGQRRGSAGVTIALHFSMEDMLRSVFWKSERDKKRNRKRDFTRKHYNSYP